MLLNGSSYTICDFATHKNGKEIRSITKKKKTKLSKLMTKFPPSNGDTKKKKNHGLDYFTETNLPKASN